MRERFVAEYFKTYGYRDETPIELMKLRVAGRGLRDNRLDFGHVKIAARAGALARRQRQGLLRARRGQRSPSMIVDRVRGRRHGEPGPLIIDEFDATIVVPPDAKTRQRRHRQHRHGTGEPMKIDPITFAVIKSGLDTIVDDMAYTVMRTARSPIVGRARLFRRPLRRRGPDPGQAKTVALHLGAVPDAMEAMLAQFGDDLSPGDVVIFNDPYDGGMHLPDIFMFKPIFTAASGCGYSVVIGHHCDVGGRVPGSNAADSTEIYQEGCASRR